MNNLESIILHLVAAAANQDEALAIVRSYGFKIGGVAMESGRVGLAVREHVAAMIEANEATNDPEAITKLGRPFGDLATRTVAKLDQIAEAPRLDTESNQITLIAMATGAALYQSEFNRVTADIVRKAANLDAYCIWQRTETRGKFTTQCGETCDVFSGRPETCPSCDCRIIFDEPNEAQTNAPAAQ